MFLYYTPPIVIYMYVLTSPWFPTGDSWTGRIERVTGGGINGAPCTVGGSKIKPKSELLVHPSRGTNSRYWRCRRRYVKNVFCVVLITIHVALSVAGRCI